MSCRILTLSACLVALLGAGCTCTPEPPAVTTPDTLPTPFSAEQIREAFRPGLSLVMESSTAAGPVRERWDVLSSDAHGMTLRTTLPADGETPEVAERRHAWTVLRDHAAFPAATATRSRATLRSPLARAPLEGWRYDIPGEGDVRTVFLFADAFPGPPLRVETFRDGEVLATMAQVARTGTEAEPPEVP